MKKETFLATLTIVGTIVGAGILGVPYVFSRAGIPLGIFYVLVLGTVAVATHGMYGLVAAATPGKHRMVGYARRFLGEKTAHVAAFSNTLAFLGALLAYLILGGDFLATLFGGNELFWTIVFVLVMALCLAMPFRRVERIEAVLTGCLIVAAIVIIGFVTGHVHVSNLVIVHPGNWFLPYGVIFFSLGGASAVPEIVDSLGKHKRSIVTATTMGTLGAALITIIFGTIVAAASGADTSPDAIRGLIPIVGHGIVALGAVFGLLAIVTSFVTISANLKEQFELDFKLPAGVSWLITIGVPAAAFAIGARNFIGVIGFLGAVFGVIDGIIIMMMARKLPHFRLRWLCAPIILLFVLGFVAEALTLRG